MSSGVYHPEQRDFGWISGAKAEFPRPKEVRLTKYRVLVAGGYNRGGGLP
jgi:hypothetical protein